MQRQLKFRGYSDLMGHLAGMVYGSGCYIDQSNKPHIVSDETGRPDFIHVREIQTWTGLRDKNGKEIYEGDIIEHPKYGKQQVVWKYGGFGLNVQHQSYWRDGFNSFATVDAAYEECEIIGNIYESHDLLK